MSEYTVEHLYTPTRALPKTLLGFFSAGACCVFADEEFIAAIPATEEQTQELADLMEIVGVGTATPDEPAMKAYNELKAKLCAPHPLEMLSQVFKQEMDRMRKGEQLASCARLN